MDNLKLGGTQNLAVRTWQDHLERVYDVVICVLVESDTEHNLTALPRKSFRLRCRCDYREPFAIGKWSKQLTEVVDKTKPDVINSWL